MARHFVRTVRGSGGARRETRWIQSTVETGTTALAASTAILDQTLGGAVDPFTIVRTRGHVWWSTDQQAALERPG